MSAFGCRFKRTTAGRGSISVLAPKVDELACVGFVQEALNRFDMGVILKKVEQMFAY
jgi:hypothetical protein